MNSEKNKKNSLKFSKNMLTFDEFDYFLGITFRRMHALQDMIIFVFNP